MRLLMGKENAISLVHLTCAYVIKAGWRMRTDATVYIPVRVTVLVMFLTTMENFLCSIGSGGAGSVPC